MAAKMSMQEALKLVMEDIKRMTPEERRAELDKHKDSPFVLALKELREFAASPEFAALMERTDSYPEPALLPAHERVVYLQAPSPFARSLTVTRRYADGHRSNHSFSNYNEMRTFAWRTAHAHGLKPIDDKVYNVTVEWGTR